MSNPVVAFGTSVLGRECRNTLERSEWLWQAADGNDLRSNRLYELGYMTADESIFFYGFIRRPRRKDACSVYLYAAYVRSRKLSHHAAYDFDERRQIKSAEDQRAPMNTFLFLNRNPFGITFSAAFVYIRIAYRTVIGKNLLCFPFHSYWV